MKVNTISNTFTLFGNFSKLLNRQNDLIKAFEAYENHVGEEQLPNGVPAKVYRFRNANTMITLRAFRIDVEFGYLNQEQTTEEFQSFVESVAQTIYKVDTVTGNRIAFSCVEFVEDPDRVVVDKLNEMFSVANVFGSAASEVNIRFNHVHSIGNEEYNSIILIQDGQVTNRQTQVQTKTVFINKDVNTVISNTQNRFRLNDVSTYLPDMIMESKERTNVILSKLD